MGRLSTLLPLQIERPQTLQGIRTCRMDHEDRTGAVFVRIAFSRPLQEATPSFGYWQSPKRSWISQLRLQQLAGIAAVLRNIVKSRSLCLLRDIPRYY